MNSRNKFSEEVEEKNPLFDIPGRKKEDFLDRKSKADASSAWLNSSFFTSLEVKPTYIIRRTYFPKKLMVPPRSSR